MSNSNLVVKMMSGEELADDNTSKGFTVVEAYGEVTCSRSSDGKPLISIPLENGQNALYHPEGNTYIIKNNKTVASFAYSKLGDVKVTKATTELKSFSDVFEPKVVLRDKYFDKIVIPHWAKPSIYLLAVTNGNNGEFSLHIKTGRAEVDAAIYAGSELVMQDPKTLDAKVFTYDELVSLINHQADPRYGFEDFCMFTQPKTGQPFQDYDLLVSVYKPAKVN